MIVVIGAGGQLGTAFGAILPEDSVLLERSDLDLEDLDRIAPLLTKLGPTSVVNCAAYTAVDAAEAYEETAFLVNGHAVGEMAAVCRTIGARFVTFSSDYVFDGSKAGPYVETDEPRPVNAYGRSKALGEQLALKENPDALVVRTSWLLSSTHRNFITAILDGVKQGGTTVVADQTGSPTFVDDLAPSALEALDGDVSGILHLVNGGATTWYELACEATELAGMDPGLVQPCTTEEYPTRARRPPNSTLSSEKSRAIGLSPMPHYRESLQRTVSEIQLSAHVHPIPGPRGRPVSKIGNLPKSGSDA